MLGNVVRIYRRERFLDNLAFEKFLCRRGKLAYNCYTNKQLQGADTKAMFCSKNK